MGQGRIVLIVSCLAPAVAAFGQAPVPGHASGGQTSHNGQILVSSSQLPPTATVNAKYVTVRYLNIFRYNVNLEVQPTLGNTPALPAIFAPSLSSFSIPATQAGVSAPPPSPPPPPQTPKQQAPPPTETPQDKAFDDLMGQVRIVQSQVGQLISDIEKKLADANSEQTCRQDEAQAYQPVILSEEDWKKLSADLASDKCTIEPDYVWPSGEVSDSVNAVGSLQVELLQFEASDYAVWSGSNTSTPDSGKTTEFTDLKSLVTGLATQVQTLASSPSSETALNAAWQYIKFWRGRAASAKVAKPDAWTLSAHLDCTAQWFGKSEGHNVSLHYVDMSSSSPSDQVSWTFTNTCLLPLTVSTGLGVTLIRNSTYAFVPSTNYLAPSPTTTLVIGYTADSKAGPIYVAQLNYGYFQKSSVGLHASLAAAVGSSAAGTNIDFLFGHAFSFAHRAVFLTPTLQMAQRQELMNGYKVGDPQGTLSSVPTINRWKAGFAFTVSFPVVQ